MFFFPNRITILALSIRVAYHPDVGLDAYWQLVPVDREFSGYAVPSTISSQHMQYQALGEYQSDS